jgi:hypothetical protein
MNRAALGGRVFEFEVWMAGRFFVEIFYITFF